ncbi:unnamed protein product [Schistocephalus solidus]|uniref:Protein dispatched homolog 1 n=1 Tax=Schistocephalus solidus TaxID=70667 RepID=A0A183SXP1_SCHSO|nr:unnamed protein product [Schistocephalus solidus]
MNDQMQSMAGEAEPPIDKKPIKSPSYRYAIFLVSFPRLSLFLVGLLLLTSLVVSLIFSKVPVFDDPAKEFVTINTVSSARLDQLEALRQNLVPFPEKVFDFESSVENDLLPLSPEPAESLPRSRRSLPTNQMQFCFENADQTNSGLWRHFASLGKMVVLLDSEVDNASHLLVNVSTVRSLCNLQKRIESLAVFGELCSRQSLGSPAATCCPIWSLPNLIASIVGRSDCDEISTVDVDDVRHLVINCRQSFLSGRLRRPCWDEAAPPQWLCPDVPPACFRHPHLIILLATALPLRHEDGELPSTWRSSLLILPIWRHLGVDMLRLMESVSIQRELTANLTPQWHIGGIDVSVYNDLSGIYVLTDCKWLALGACLLSIVLLIITDGSVLMLLVTLFAILWSLTVAYAIYSRVISIPTFPLINVWRSARLSGGPVCTTTAHTGHLRPSNRAQLLTYCLRHATPSVCLTSLSTAVGLLVSLSANIVAVKRFAIFATICVCCHLVYILLAVPCILANLSHTGSCHTRSLGRRFMTQLARLVLRLRFLFPCAVACLLITAFYLLFHYRLLDFPRGVLHTAFYRNSHPAEVYRWSQGGWFWAEERLRHYRLLHVELVWGLLPRDSRSVWSWLPGFSHRPVILNPAFNLSSREARVWLSHFCSNQLKMMPGRSSPQGSSTAAEPSGYFEESVLLSAVAPSGGTWCPFGRHIFSLENYLTSVDCATSLSKCCVADAGGGYSSVPLDIATSDAPAFEECLLEYLKATTARLPSQNGAGFHFQPGGTRPVAFTISLTSNISLNEASHNELSTYAQRLSKWFDDAQASAPESLSGGFLLSPELAAFEVYKDLLKFLPWSLGISLSLATTLVLLSTLNVALSVAALLSVLASQLSCTVLLVLLDNWQLGVVEALIISLSAGLAIDPCLHLAFALVPSRKEPVDWCRQARSALELVGGAVTGGALTTAVAGAAVLPSVLNCYHQVGSFLVILMFSSWCLCAVSFTGIVACFPARRFGCNGR